MFFYLVIWLCLVVNNDVSGAIAASERRDDPTEHPAELVGEHVGEDILTRFIRSAKTGIMCKYKKGEWSACDKMLRVS